MTRINPAGQVKVEHNGKIMKVCDLPDAGLRALCGYGHFPASYSNSNRSVVNIPGHTWPWTPSTCSPDEYPTLWINNDTILVCTGCGLDGT